LLFQGFPFGRKFLGSRYTAQQEQSAEKKTGQANEPWEKSILRKSQGARLVLQRNDKISQAEEKDNQRTDYLL
jgi:hypothetical protein